MATSSSTPSVLFTNPVPIIISRSSPEVVVRVPSKTLRSLHLSFRRNPNGSTRLNAAGLSEIEPDLNEDKVDRWRTNGVSPEDYVYGEYDGHHTYHEGHEKGTFWGAIAEDYAATEPPTGFQGLISWIFPPAVALGYAYHVPGDYLFIGAAVFVVIFCMIEMGKPDKPHNFEPQIYNMERGARDKLIADYNTMDIWDFNEKYGDLWDFTVKKDNIEKR
ncbi:photosynthetic NDH subunit of subcomplex B 5, chloroplastic-like [Macadamia integrifolia]|uniref:photosynthetic NDH subunit of subcomplex B 5, chloroplastic-like n=1 Tax=Macadamia integrifolia TaxID=60698 RepID=UPI001C529D52|nr:photosynthetic NDH subunit of subcomplex B 5, chloroplastic-like [Macadamia integrifolia]XP_042480569.1 photosynthetic NDH subunit of subcomplex B 5, chloroplastic-like [Macadamia integrifolia]